MQTSLDFNGRTQLYFQLYDILREAILSGKYKPDELLPTENEMIEKFKVSRVTVRKALDLLTNDGLISKRRGYGTFVKKPKLEQPLSQVLHFSNEMEKRGKKSSTMVLANELTDATPEIAKALEVPEDTKLAHVKRLRSADGVPMCVESAYLIYTNCPLVLSQDFSNQSLRKYLQENYDIIWRHAHQNIYAIKADAELASHLDVKKGDPLFYIERISYDQHKKAGEYLQAYYRGDTYCLTVEMAVSQR